MTDAIPTQNLHRSLSPWLPVAATLWIAAIVTMATLGIFDVPPNEPALPTLAAIFAPVALFVAATVFHRGFRDYILTLDPILLTELQAWRIFGGVFLVVLAFGLLPGAFAWPAGLGDVAVGLAAPFIALKLRQDPAFLTSRRYLAFVLFGLADFAVAITLGVLSRNAIDGLAGPVTSVPMGQLPLVLIPTLAVPTFIVLHLIVLLQIRERRSAN